MTDKEKNKDSLPIQKEVMESIDRMRKYSCKCEKDVKFYQTPILRPYY